jgi:hypothetical protein
MLTRLSGKRQINLQRVCPFERFVFEGWVPADLANTVRFRAQSSSMQMSGPTAYVAGLLAKEDRWNEGLVQFGNAMPPTERVEVAKAWIA